MCEGNQILLKVEIKSPLVYWILYMILLKENPIGLFAITLPCLSSKPIVFFLEHMSQVNWTKIIQQLLIHL